jgi:DNA-binding transcriptional LysR family regulator
MVVIVPKDHPLATSKVITIKEFLTLDLMGGEAGSGTGTLLKRVLGRRASKLRITHNLQSTEAVKSAVQAGLGCSIVLAGAVRDEAATERFAVLELEGTQARKAVLCCDPGRLPRGAMARRLFEFIAPVAHAR